MQQIILQCTNLICHHVLNCDLKNNFFFFTVVVSHMELETGKNLEPLHCYPLAEGTTRVSCPLNIAFLPNNLMSTTLPFGAWGSVVVKTLRY